MRNKRLMYIGACALASEVVGLKFGEALAASDAALAGIISVFSILAGVLVAVISIIGDPSMLLTGNWRLGHEHAKEMQKRIGNYANLIFLYVLILIVVLVATVLKDNHVVNYRWVFSLLIGLTTFGLLLSIPLPYSLMAIQKERMAEEIKRRKANPPAQ